MTTEEGKYYKENGVYWIKIYIFQTRKESWKLGEVRNGHFTWITLPFGDFPTEKISLRELIERGIPMIKIENPA